MNFTISRTSRMSSKNPKKPCEGAYESQINGQPYWMISITSLAHLIRFVREHGQNAIISTNTITRIPEIEIYDTYSGVGDDNEKT